MTQFKEHLSGPRLASWLEETFPGLADGHTEALVGPSGARRIREWKRGAVAHVDTADRICVRLGLVIDQDVPEEFWIEEAQRKPRIA